MKKLLFSVIGAVLGLGVLLLLGLGAISLFKSSKLGGVAYPAIVSTDFVYASADVVGTHTGTSTIGVWFDKTGVTSTYVTRIGDRQEAVYTAFMTVANTSTAQNVNFTVQGSNDFQCDTTNTSTSATPNSVIQSDINWFPAGDNLIGKAQTTALTNASSTNVVTWTSASVGNGQTLQLEKLNFQCLRLGVAAVSSTLYIGIKTR